MEGLAWTVLDDRARSGPENMAVDHALAEHLAPGCAYLRLYEWTEPTVSFGRHEPSRGRYGSREGVAFVRRPTGGKAVLHREELTYAVVFPAVRGLREAYVEIHEALRDALGVLGVEDGRLASPRAASSPGSGGTCFEEPVGGEVLVSAGKLVGSAQARLGNTILQHGSLLRVDDQTQLDTLRGQETRATRPAATLAEVLGAAPPVARMREAVRAAFERRFGPLSTHLDVESLEQKAKALMKIYGSEDWTWRR